MDKYIFVAKFKYGQACLAKVKVKKETAKTFAVESDEALLGFIYVGKRILKDEEAWFETGLDALHYLQDKANEYIRECELRTVEARTRSLAIERLIDACNESS